MFYAYDLNYALERLKSCMVPIDTTYLSNLNLAVQRRCLIGRNIQALSSTSEVEEAKLNQIKPETNQIREDLKSNNGIINGEQSQVTEYYPQSINYVNIDGFHIDYKDYNSRVLYLNIPMWEIESLFPLEMPIQMAQIKPNLQVESISEATQSNMNTWPLAIEYKVEKRDIVGDVKKEELKNIYSNETLCSLAIENSTKNYFNEKRRKLAENFMQNGIIGELFNEALNPYQSKSEEYNTTIEVEESPFLFFGRQFRFNNVSFIETDNTYEINRITTKSTEDSLSDTRDLAHFPKTQSNSHHDFKKSLECLREIIESCRQEPEQNLILASANLHKSKKKEKISNMKVFTTKNGKSKATKNQTNYLDSAYKNQSYVSPKMPEMSKMYQIFLQNKMPQGVSFEFVTPNKSKVQMLFISNPRKKYASKFNRGYF